MSRRHIIFKRGLDKLDRLVNLDETDRQILKFCDDEENHRGPVYSTIAKAIGAKSKGAITRRIKRLRDLGLLSDNNKAIRVKLHNLEGAKEWLSKD